MPDLEKHFIFCPFFVYLFKESHKSLKIKNAHMATYFFIPYLIKKRHEFEFA